MNYGYQFEIIVLKWQEKGAYVGRPPVCAMKDNDNTEKAN
jgi:hypothetical protein